MATLSTSGFFGSSIFASTAASTASGCEPAPEQQWLFHKLGVLFLDAGRRFGFDLEGFLDPLQFTEYGAGQHFEWHMDTGRDQTSLRKLSVTIQHISVVPHITSTSPGCATSVTICSPSASTAPPMSVRSPTVPAG